MPDLIEMRVSERHLKAIGLLTARHSFLESITQVAIWRFLAASENMGRAVTADQTASNRLHLLRTLANERMNHESNEYAQLDDIMKRVQSANEDRNSVVHADFALASYAREGIVEKHSARSKLKVTPKYLPVEEIEAMADRVAGVTSDLFSFLSANETAPFFDPVESIPLRGKSGRTE